jgi:hypothetical protein
MFRLTRYCMLLGIKKKCISISLMNLSSMVIQICIYTKRTSPFIDSRKSNKDQNKDLKKVTNLQQKYTKNNLADLKYIMK